jgi:arginine/lysine/ornithine decarboxylase
VDILAKIKRLVIARRLRFTFKADLERIADGLTVEDIVESLVNAPAINKTLRSRSPSRLQRWEKLYVIISPTYDGTLVYTKGTIRKIHGSEEYYLLISAKRDVP